MQINLHDYLYITINITRVHIKEIAVYFENDEVLAEDTLKRSEDFNIDGRQASHQRATNQSLYSLDKAFPNRDIFPFQQNGIDGLDLRMRMDFVNLLQRYRRQELGHVLY
jgi:hypothetical protein